jgi:hypothetical protein
MLGYFAGTLVLDPTWAVYVSVLASYHIFLLWLVLSGEQKAGVSLSPVSTIVTHMACLALIVPVGMARHLPLFGIVRYGIISLAIFERGWLFSSSQVEQKTEEATAPPIVLQATAEDFEAWRQHLATRKATQRRAGMSVREEYEHFLHTRARKRSA